MPVITVSQINKYIGFILKGDRNLQGVMVRGEIFDFVCHYRSGHMYFTLKDSESSIKAVMFAQAASRLKFMPEDGMSVVVSGNISIFERDGVYQLYVSDIIPEGAGKASAAFEQLKKKLAAAGLFDTLHKRTLPVMPRKIGAVTSLSGAAVRDVINVLSRRYPIGEIYAVNALVQGDEAPDSICRGIIKAENAGCDVIIVGRGGGSAEDLSAFNTEKVAYAIFNCKVPVISAVGHETDFSIADLTADMRAPTPSAAAELVAPSIESIRDRIDILDRRIEQSAISILDKAADSFIGMNARIIAQSPKNRLKLNNEKIISSEKALKTAFVRYIDRLNSVIAEKAAKLEALSPLKVLSRGYSLVYKDGELLSRSLSIHEGDHIEIRFGSGGAEAEILKKW